MRNPIKKHFDKAKLHTDFWFEGTLLNFLRCYGREKYNKMQCTLSIDDPISDPYSDEEIHEMMLFIQLNKDDLIQKTFIKEIKLYGEVVYTNYNFG